MSETVGVVSLGCAKNRVDTEQMLGLLKKWNYTITDKPAEADILIVNTCGFIDSAKQESIDTLFEMAAYKQSGRCRLLIATGCLVQRYVDALYDDMPEIDAFVGVGEYPRLQEIIAQASKKRRPVACASPLDLFEAPRVLTTPPYTAYVRTGEGCDNRCAYCAIPLIRGPYRSRPYANILAECCMLTVQGVSEITFVAQDTSRYGEDLIKGRSLSSLIADTCAIDGVHWVRALYCYPSHVDEQLLDVLADEPKACAYLDLPLQHIDADILRAMHRKGSPDEIRALLRQAKARNITLRTTMIVGFPGETEAAFERLLDFVREIRFDRLGAFAYSAEEGTRAAEMPGQVPEEVKQERLSRLMELQQGISLENNQKRIGEVVEVLIERERNGLYVARSQKEAPEGDGVLLLTAKRALVPGMYVTARIDGADVYDCTGEVL